MGEPKILLGHNRDGQAITALFITGTLVSLIFSISLVTGAGSERRAGALALLGAGFFVLVTIRWWRLGITQVGSTLVVRAPLRTTRVDASDVREIGIFQSLGFTSVFLRTDAKRIAADLVCQKVDGLRAAVSAIEASIAEAGGRSSVAIDPTASEDIVAPRRRRGPLFVFNAFLVALVVAGYWLPRWKWFGLVVVFYLVARVCLAPENWHVSVGPADLTIRNTWRTHRILSPDVSAVDVVGEARRRRVRVTTTDGRVIDAAATKGRANVDEIADRIRDAVAQHVG